MLSASQISDKVAQISIGALSAYEFERWFRAESRNFHQWASPELADAIFEVENALSEYHDSDLDDAGVAQLIADALPPVATSEQHEVLQPLSPFVQHYRAILRAFPETEIEESWELYRKPPKSETVSTVADPVTVVPVGAQV